MADVGVPLTVGHGPLTIHPGMRPSPTRTTSPEETIAFGRELASRLEAGDVVALYGTLGAGKTHLVKGICAGLGIDEAEVSSPTFTVVHEYEGRDFPVYHFDAYRIERPDEFYELGYEEYFYGEGICLVEWPEHIEALLPKDALRLRLAHAGEQTRTIEVL